jgi:hypothetical protein
MLDRGRDEVSSLCGGVAFQDGDGVALSGACCEDDLVWG